METLKFETGNIYEMRYVTNSDLRVKFICVKRTDKTVSFERFGTPTEKLNRRIKFYNGEEFVKDGDYSFAPSIYASNLVG